MRAVQITEQGDPGVLRLVELPDPRPGAGEVLIRVESAAMNFSDVNRRRGTLHPFPTPLPFVPGGEVAGTVAALGAGVEGPPVGTRVFALVGADGSGGYAELAVAASRQVVPIPDGLSADEAAGITIAGVTATLLLTGTARLAPGESVLVPGAAGGVGGFAVQIAKLLGAGPVVAAAGSAAKRAAALELGADHAVDPGAPGWPQAAREAAGGAGVDVALEMAGGDRLAETIATLAPFGRAVVYGMASGIPGRLPGETVEALLYRASPNQALHAFNLGLWFGLRPDDSVAALRRLVGWVARGEVRVPVGRAFPLEQAAAAHRAMEDGATAGKVVLRP